MAEKYDIGPKLGIEGEAQFKSAISAVNANLKALASEMKACTSEFANNDKSLEALNKKQQILGQQMEATKQKISVLNGQYQTQKSRLTELGSALERAKQEFGENSTEAAKAQNAYNRQSAECSKLQQQINEATNSLNQMTNESQSNEQALQRLGDSTDEVGENLNEVGENAGKAGKAMDDAGEQSQGFGSKLKEAVSGAGQLLGDLAMKVVDIGKQLGSFAIDFAKDSIAVGQQFDASMSQVAAVSGATGEDFDALRAKAQEMGAKTKFSASEAADAMNYMAMAGWKTDDMVSGIEGIMNLAAASGEDLATTSDIVTDALTAFGLTAKDSAHFADILAAASSNANTDVAMMGETFKYAAPVAGALGFSAEDTAEAIGLMGNSGIKASQAGTSLRGIFTALAGEVKICGRNIGEVEIQTTNADGSMRGLSEILADCRDVFGQLSESEQSSAAQALVGKNAMSGFLALMNAAPGDIEKVSGAIANCSFNMDDITASLEQSGVAWDKYANQAWAKAGDGIQKLAEDIRYNVQDVGTSTEDLVRYLKQEYGMDTVDAVNAINSVKSSLEETTGAAEKMAGVMQDNLAGDITIFQSAMEGAQIALSDKLTPALREVVQFGSEAVSSLTTAFQEGGLSGLMTEFGNVVANAATKIVESLPAIVEAGTQLITGLVDGIVQNFPALTEAAGEIMGTLINCILEALPQLLESGGQLVSMILQGISEGTPQLLESGGALVQELGTGIQEGIPDLVAKLPEVVTGITGFFTENLPQILDMGVQILNSIVNGILNSIPELVAALPDVIDAFVTFVTDNLPLIIESGIDILMNLIDGIIQTIPELIAAIPDVIDSIVNTLSENGPSIIESGVNLLLKLVEGIGSAIPELVAMIPDIIVTIVTTLVENFPKIVESGVDILTSIVDGIGSVLGKISEAGGDIVQAVIDAISRLMGDLGDIGGRIVDGIKGGISGAWGRFTGWLGEKAGGLITGVKNVLGIRSPSKEFAKIGSFMVQGLGEGFGDEFSGVQRQINRSMDDLVYDSAQTAQGAVPAAQGYGSGTSSLNASILAEAIRAAMEGCGVYMDGRRVGNLITTRQQSDSRARGVALLPV